jgi:L-alanine-DL-glutamate epimerase-like enolase superfamily enzyme
MQIECTPLPLTKRYPLTISRGTSAGSENLLITVTHAGIVGRGEFAPVSIAEPPETATTAEREIHQCRAALAEVAPWEMQRIAAQLDALPIGRAARAALDIALHDWLGRYCGMPLYQLLGADRNRIAPTSVTIGISSPETARERVQEVLARTGARCLKIKLGSPEGLDADRAMLAAVKVAAPDIPLRVDANGGWTPLQAKVMIRWLAEQGVELVEQPLPRGLEEALPHLFTNRPLPIFADESCWTFRDVPALSDRVDGVNLKLMKAGGIREGLQLIHTARAHGLQVMIGCMSESTLAISAGAHLSPFADYLDLDSHLNLQPDPFTGLILKEGRLLPNDHPGLGVEQQSH